MNRNKKVATMVMAAVAGFGVGHREAQAITWSGGAGGGTAWLTTTNWSGSVVPNGTGVAEFQAAGTGTPLGINMNGTTNTAATDAFGGKIQLIGEILVSAGNDRIINNSTTTAGKDGTLQVNGVNSGTNILFSDTIAKTLTLNNGATAGGVPIQLRILFPNAGDINVATGGSIVLNSMVTASGTVNKTGSGTLTLNSVAQGSSYAGGITVSGGTLLVNNPSTAVISVTGGITTSSGTTLGGTGTVSGTVTSAGAISGGTVGTVGTFNVGALTLNAGSSLTEDMAPSSQDLLVANGLTLTGAVTVNLGNLGGISNKTIDLIDYAPGSFSGTTSQFSIGTAPVGPTYHFIDTGTAIQLQITGAAQNLTWLGTPTGTWNTSNANWTGGTGVFGNGDVVTFDDSGATTVTVGAGGVSPGAMTFANNNSNYTIGGGSIGGTSVLTKTGTGTVTLSGSNSYNGPTTVSAGTLQIMSGGAIGSTPSVTLSGGAVLQAGANLTMTTPVSFGVGGGKLDTQGFSETWSGTASGSGAITKVGTGTLTLTGSGGTSTSTVAISAGKISVQAVDASGVTALGKGAITIGSGGTLELAGATVGFAPGLVNGTSITVNIADGGTLAAVTNGASTVSAITGTIGFPVSTGATTAVGYLTAGAGATLYLGSSPRNNGTQTTNNTSIANVQGAGVVVLTAGPVSSTSTTQFNGSWQVNMDQSTGVLAVGPALNGGFGEPLNALGYNGLASGSGSYNGPTRPVTVTSGTLAFGADQPTQSTTAPITTNTYRSPLTLDGGKIASTGFDYAAFNTSTGNTMSTTVTVTANLASDITMNASKTSTVSLYDPITGAGAGSRSLNILNDTVTSSITGNVTWGSGSTLVVDAGGTSGGVLAINRDSSRGTVLVGGSPTPVLQINNGATVSLTGTMTPLYSGSAYVDVNNQTGGAFNVSTNVQSAGNISGGGTTSVSSGAALDTGSIVQGTVNLTGSSILVRSGSSTGSIGTLSIDGGSKFDLNNNKTVLNGTLTTASTVLGYLSNGRNGGTWNGSGGIDSTAAGAEPNLATAIGYASGSALLGLGGAATASWNGQTVNANSILLKYTYYGDLNLDGKIDGDDYALIDKQVALHGLGSSGSWINGDVDYSGTVTAGDYLLIDTAFANQGGVLSPDFLAEREAEFGSAYVSQLIASVPEPTSISMIGLVGAGMLARRRRTA